jgi:hypothetical protein
VRVCFSPVFCLSVDCGCGRTHQRCADGVAESGGLAVPICRGSTIGCVSRGCSAIVVIIAIAIVIVMINGKVTYVSKVLIPKALRLAGRLGLESHAHALRRVHGHVLVYCMQMWCSTACYRRLSSLAHRRFRVWWHGVQEQRRAAVHIACG